MIATRIQLYDKKINSAEWEYFLRGGTGEAQIP